MTHTKSIAKGKGKSRRWTQTPTPGAHAKLDALTPLTVIRDLLQLADTTREVKHILRSGAFSVDKKTVKHLHQPLGLMDSVELPALKKQYRVVPTKKGLALVDIPEKEASFKPCAITGKTLVKGGSIQINLHDGTNLVAEKDEHAVGDTLILTLPDRKIKQSLARKKGHTALIVAGRHAGSTGTIKEVTPRTATRPSQAEIGDLETLTDYLFVIGEKEPAFTL